MSSNGGVLANRDINIQKISTAKMNRYVADANMLRYWRRNPIEASKDILGIPLIDSQKLILQNSWNTPYVCWCCSRNYGKSFLGSILMILKSLLYPNQKIFIVSSVGSQSKNTFKKIEDIAMDRIDSAKSLKNIFRKEVVTNHVSKNGFSKDPAGHKFSTFNDSFLQTLNGIPDNLRSNRATMVFFDEAGFSSEELITIAEAFTTQDAGFSSSIDEEYNEFLEAIKVPNQLVYASSASTVNTTFYTKYREFSRQMFIGDKNFYVADINCEIPMNPFMDGKPTKALLDRTKVETALRTNREKAMREYYNKFVTDGVAGQVFLRNDLLKASTLVLPELGGTGKNRYVIAFDPARSQDNSIVGVMKVVEHEDAPPTGELVFMRNMHEAGKGKLKHQISPKQLKQLRDIIIDFNCDAPNYGNIEAVMIDSGAGGGGVSAYADNLIYDWVDSEGNSHKGLIDLQGKYYEGRADEFPNAIDKLRLISTSDKVKMVEHTMKLVEVSAIKLTREYDDNGYVLVESIDSNGEDSVERRKLNLQEELALMNIDIMKEELACIKKSDNGKTVSYDLMPEKKHKMHDDRFYVFIMLGQKLYELRKAYSDSVHSGLSSADFGKLPVFTTSLKF